MLTFKQIEALVWIAKMGTFERAADKLNIAQSTISKRIAELEELIGVEVFDRTRRDSKLTAEGEKLLALGEKMLDIRAEALSLNGMSEMPSRKVRIGVTELTALTWLPRLISALRARYPNVSFEPTVEMTRNLHQGLIDGTFELVIAPESFQVANSTVIRVALVRNAWVASPALIKPGQAVSYEELATYTIITQGKSSGSGLLISGWMRAHGIALPNQMTCDSLVALLGLTVAGVGASYVPVECQEPLIQQGKLHVLNIARALPDVPYAAMFMNEQPNLFISEIAELAKSLCNFRYQFQ